MTSEATKRPSINPGATQAMYDAFHFSQAMRVRNMIWVSGQVGVTDFTEESGDLVCRLCAALSRTGQISIALAVQAIDATSRNS